jgi:hypothetical protein
MNTSLFLSVNQPCDETLRWTKEQLSQSNLRAVQTFDLQSARTGLHDCPCPHHGTEDCDCQMVVVLVYGKAMDPATLILHGSDGQTWLSLVNNSNQPTDESIRSTIERALQLDPAE